ncbi:hypothetical protein BDP27DRAFT_1366662 [Rhodocollybia butyracea]|uniref:Uncharacterized protein n=1 Tax=Rhodocollybia butyracea TaxID=206335 RepID=A0A9P5PKS5_9AGAR|nr:hypothetical protein BDP27DRAFT_1366662 [Rhodocollybia butyracea]
MFDEIATEKRPRWDSRTNHFLGSCQEHGNQTCLKFENENDLKMMVEDVEQENVHLASEATVGAVGLLSGDTCIYGTRLILISGTCKKEQAPEHAILIQNSVSAINIRAPDFCIGTVSLASDGEAKRGKSLVMIMFKHSLKCSGMEARFLVMCRLRLRAVEPPKPAVFEPSLAPAVIGLRRAQGPAQNSQSPGPGPEPELSA